MRIGGSCSSVLEIGGGINFLAKGKADGTMGVVWDEPRGETRDSSGDLHRVRIRADPQRGSIVVHTQGHGNLPASTKNMRYGQSSTKFIGT